MQFKLNLSVEAIYQAGSLLSEVHAIVVDS